MERWPSNHGLPTETIGGEWGLLQRGRPVPNAGNAGAHDDLPVVGELRLEGHGRCEGPPVAHQRDIGQRRIGKIADKAFTRRFFAIWLGPNTKDPALRNRLIGRTS